MPYHGQMALQIALLVAFTQLIPEHQVQVMGVFKARVKVCFSVECIPVIIPLTTINQSLPMAYLTLSTVLCILGWQNPWILIQFGWFVGWVYLRFYKKNPGESVGGVDTYGDRSETFSLISWFPPFLQYVFCWCVLDYRALMSNTADRLQFSETLFTIWRLVSI